MQQRMFDQLAHHYPRFRQVAVPAGTFASHAFEGTLSPFANASRDAAAEILSDITNEKPVLVDAGELRRNPESAVVEDSMSFTLDASELGTTFRILLLFAEGRRPRVYSLSPEISRVAFPDHPHLADIHGIWLTRFIPALCIARPSALPPPDTTLLVSTLDHTALYLAKHLLWGHIRRATQLATWDSTRFFFGADPSLVLLPHFIERCAGRQNKVAWSTSIWPGKSATHDIAALLQELRPNDECQCGSMLRYGDCCRPHHVAQLAEIVRSLNNVSH
jgi:hypothetical protein